MTKHTKWFVIFLLCMPFIDYATSIATWENFFSIGLIIKSIFFLGTILYLLINSKQKKKIYLIFGILLLYGGITLTLILQDSSLNLMEEISNLIKIFYLPTLFLFFSEYENPNITKKTVTIIFLFYLLLYLVPYLFGLGHNMSEIYPNKDLYLSYFYIGNELANIFIFFIPISLTYLIEEKKEFLIPMIILILAMLYLLGTKAMYLSIVIIICFLIIYYWHHLKEIVKRNWLKLTGIILILIVSLMVLLPKTSFYQNIKTTLEFYHVDSIQDVLSFEKINQVIYSNRLTFLANINEEYQKSSLRVKLFGMGRTKINEIKDIEIDIFDIFYSIGIVGTILYILYCIFAFTSVKLKPLYLFSLGLLLIISLFSGHVLISPMVSTYLGMIPLLNKNERTKNK